MKILLILILIGTTSCASVADFIFGGHEYVDPVTGEVIEGESEQALMMKMVTKEISKIIPGGELIAGAATLLLGGGALVGRRAIKRSQYDKMQDDRLAKIEELVSAENRETPTAIA